MPLTAIKINNFDVKLIKETTVDNELQKRIVSLFVEDKRFHEFLNEDATLKYLNEIFSQQHALYVGMFNDKPICTVVAQEVTIVGSDCASREVQLSRLAMHQSNLDRGIEEQFFILIIKQLIEKKVLISSKNNIIMQLIKKCLTDNR